VAEGGEVEMAVEMEVIVEGGWVGAGDALKEKEDGEAVEK
jgi:hypothetical protein